jgi:hypothetical protein
MFSCGYFSVCFSPFSIFTSTVLFIKGNGKLWLIYGSILLSLNSVAIGSVLHTRSRKGKNAYAVLLASVADAKNVPDGAKVLFTVHEGVKSESEKQKTNGRLSVCLMVSADGLKMRIWEI